MRITLFFLLGALAAGTSRADTLFLRTGKTLKVDALSCDAKTCIAMLSGGGVEVDAKDVVRVVPDEQVDSEAAVAAPASATLGPVEALPRLIDRIVVDMARKYALPPSLILAVARAESSLNPTAVSPRGARGVMQLMAGTAQELGVKDAFDPADNIEAGARLLRRLLEKYDGRVAVALAAYNAGEGAVARNKGVPPYRETHSYIRKVVKDFEREEKAIDSPRPAPRP